MCGRGLRTGRLAPGLQVAAPSLQGVGTIACAVYTSDVHVAMFMLAVLRFETGLRPQNRASRQTATLFSPFHRTPNVILAEQLRIERLLRPALYCWQEADAAVIRQADVLHFTHRQNYHAEGIRSCLTVWRPLHVVHTLVIYSWQARLRPRKLRPGFG